MINKNKCAILFSIILVCFFTQGLVVFAQTSMPAAKPAASVASEKTDAKPGTDEPDKTVGSLPKGYRDVVLGLSLEEAKKALLADSLFGYRGERDVSLLPTQNRVLIETAGMSFISRSWLQFYDDKLYTLVLTLNPAMVDFYSVFKSLTAKYGEPSGVNPEKITWQDEAVTLTLERPLTLKYVDAVVFKTLLDASQVKETAVEIIRKDFLDSL